MRFPFLGVLCAWFLLSACGAQEGASSASVAAPSASANQAYRVLMLEFNEPFSMSRNSSSAGFEYELLQAIAAKQNL